MVVQLDEARDVIAGPGDETVVGAPLAGWVTPLELVPDPVFSGKVLGDGLAIDPYETVLRAPCGGVVLTIHRAHHALTLKADSGAELLMHIGLDTVTMKGEGFKVMTAEGQRVAPGGPLIAFDLDVVSTRVPSLMVPVVLTNGDDFEIVSRASEGSAAAGAEILRVRPKKVAAAPAAIGEEAREQATVAAPNGLHARPAGLIAQRAREFSSEITLQVGDKKVSARSAVALMALGLDQGVTVAITARGADAAVAARALAEMIATLEAHAGPSATARPVAAAPASTTLAAVLAAPMLPFPEGAEVRLNGFMAAPGLAIGRAARIERRRYDPPKIGAGEGNERARLAEALARAQGAVKNRLAAVEAGGAAHGILSAHLTFLEDPELRAAAEDEIRTGWSAGWAWRKAVEGQIAVLKQAGQRFVERVNDLEDIDGRVQAALLGETDDDVELPPGSVLVAADLLPSQFVGLAAGRVAAIVTELGGPTSHVSILAAARGIPALVAVGPEAARIPSSAPMLVDADKGVVTVWPTEALQSAARSAMAARRTRAAEAEAAAHELGQLADGKRIEVVANLGSLADVKPALACGAEGSGLLRTEFLFLNRNAPPDEESQLADYQAIAAALEGRPLVIRTLDAGADKALPYLEMEEGENPQLGVRGVRLGLERPDLLRTQLRAILRVKPAGQCKIMLPMIADLEEVRTVRRMVDEEKAKLGIAAKVEFGIMIEVPSAAVMANELAAETDFFSVGTNDLTQYVLAMDRMNPALARYADALHPAVLRLIKMAADGAHAHGRWIGVCGALAADPLAAPVLVGLGVTELSGTAKAVPRIKAMLRKVMDAECRKAAEEALAQKTAADVRAALAARWPDA
ncbi:phosphoenolpyruvate--protein phosphotransferase [Bradyrhizobium diazoefficiens]|nr:phosphoenolpyruvate--protein phosphotransferase [Bradyrhizobium diazoefficiens]MBR0851638.1 phosphoenolpyruvate--protein phosphotransferase [Bradyrhizobium diazoefficiens]